MSQMADAVVRGQVVYVRNWSKWRPCKVLWDTNGIYDIMDLTTASLWTGIERSEIHTEAEHARYLLLQ